MTNKRYIKYISATVLVILTVISLRLLGRNEKFLNYFAHYYFDQNYYLEHYPEVKSQNIDPFDHYVKYGWKEGKNPSETFETTFYVRQYFREPVFKNKYDLNPLADYVKSKLFFKEYHLTNSKQVLKTTLLAHPKYYISLVAIFQNEARFLKEWIEFYRLMGVEHFYLYNHLSSDEYMDILEPYIKNGIVELKQVTKKPKNLKEWNIIQTTAYTDAVIRTKDSSEWLIVVDTDEFLFPIKDKNLVELLKKYDDYAALSVDWKIFGSGDVEKIESDKLLIESLTKSTDQEDLRVKTIVKPRYVDKFKHPHFPFLLPCYSQVTENFEFFRGAFAPKETRNIVTINHYWARDLEFFKSHKLARIHVAGDGPNSNERNIAVDALMKTNRDASVLYDASILRFVNELRKRVIKPPLPTNFP
jgi:hypothetical protein